MIEIQNVTRRYGKLEAVRDLSFTAPKGQITGLLGQNGAGKTTTLNMITGYLPPSSGRILIDGTDLLKDGRECRRKLGYLPEKPPLYDEMTVREYLTFVCNLREVRRSAVHGHIDHIMEMCGLTEVRDRLLGTLSKGYRQRAGFAQTLCGDPPVLIFDEPTVGLDPRQVVEMRELMRTIGRDHTVLFSSHILSEIQQLCSRAIILHKGRLVREVDLTENGTDRIMNLRMTVLGPEQQLLQAIRSCPCVLRASVFPVGEPGTASFELKCRRQDEDPRVSLFRLMTAKDAPILSMMQVKEPLEELFLKVTSEGMD